MFIKPLRQNLCTILTYNCSSSLIFESAIPPSVTKICSCCISQTWPTGFLQHLNLIEYRFLWCFFSFQHRWGSEWGTYKHISTHTNMYHIYMYTLYYYNIYIYILYNINVYINIYIYKYVNIFLINKHRWGSEWGTYKHISTHTKMYKINIHTICKHISY